MFKNRFGIQWFFEEEGKGGGGGGDDDKASRNLQSLLAKKDGDAMGVAAQLLTENAELRADKRKLKSDLTAAEAKAPAEGAVILTGDEAAKYNALVELGTPEKIKERLDNEAALVTKDAEATKRTALEAAVKAAGYDPKAVAALNGALDLSFLVEKETKDGKAVDVAYIQDGDKKRAAGEVLAEKYGQDLIDRLKLEQSVGGTVVSPALSGLQQQQQQLPAQKPPSYSL